MKNNISKKLVAAIELREILETIMNLLDGYCGIAGNENYIKYCLNKSKQVNNDFVTLDILYNDIYHIDVTKRKGINISILLDIIERYFKLLDDIDTASDIFKPRWCKITSAVNKLQQLRWLVVTIDGQGETMDINGNCYKKEDRVTLIL